MLKTFLIGASIPPLFVLTIKVLLMLFTADQIFGAVVGLLICAVFGFIACALREAKDGD